jgi:hypothetical protein
MQTLKGTKKLALNGVCYEKKYNIWCVTSTRIQKSHRRIYQRFFNSGEAAAEYMKGIVTWFVGKNPEAELTKDDFLKTWSGEVRKANKTYTFGGNPWNKQIFHLKKVNVLELCEEGNADDMEEEDGVSKPSPEVMRRQLGSMNYSEDYISKLGDSELDELWEEEFGSVDDVED